MTIRQLCDVTYTYLAQDMPPKEVENLNRELRADPSRGGGRQSRGTEDLMAVMTGFRGQR